MDSESERTRVRQINRAPGGVGSTRGLGSKESEQERELERECYWYYVVEGAWLGTSEIEFRVWG